MRHTQVRRSGTAVAVQLVGLALLVVAVSLAFAEDRDSTESSKVAVASDLKTGRGDDSATTTAQTHSDEQAARRAFTGTDSCRSCHRSGANLKNVPLPGGATLDLTDEQWVQQTEYPVWTCLDKHSQAYAVLFNERSKRMGRLLGVKQIHRDVRCLTCHTGFSVRDLRINIDEHGQIQSGISQGLVSERLSQALDITNGVSCESCHGPAGDVRRGGELVLAGWIGPHDQLSKPWDSAASVWRFQSPAKKQRSGYADVRSPISKAKICVSCHIGNFEQGKILTHEMYAAGHPPLPGFEIETFIDHMPKHWQSLERKPAKVRNEFLAKTRDPQFKSGSYDPNSLRRTQSMLIGALVALSESLRLTSQLANPDSVSPVSKPDWPEVSQFQCLACHHELRSPKTRQVRIPKRGRPGRPSLQEWPLLLADVAMTVVTNSETTLDDTMAPLMEAVDVRPFGIAADIHKQSAIVAKELMKVAQTLANTPLSQVAAMQVRNRLLKIATTRYLNYDSARQLVWGFKIVQAERAQAGGKPTTAILDRIEQELYPWSPLPTRINTEGQCVEDDTVAVQKVHVEERGRNVLEANMPRILKRVSNYDPQRIRQRFRVLATRLKGQ